MQNRCGGWGEGVSQYIRGLVKTQSVLVNYNSFLGFEPEELRDWQQPQYLLQNPYNYEFMGLFGFQCQIWKFVQKKKTLRCAWRIYTSCCLLYSSAQVRNAY